MTLWDIMLMMMMMIMICPVSRPGRHAQIMRWCGLEQVRFFSNPVPTSESGQPSPIIWVPNPHSLIQTRRSSMSMTIDKWKKYNRQRTKVRPRGGTNLTNGGYKLTCVLKTRNLVLLYTERPEIYQLPSSVRIRYCAWAWTFCNLLFQNIIRLSKFRNRTGDPEHGKYQSISLEILSPRWDFWAIMAHRTWILEDVRRIFFSICTIVQINFRFYLFRK